MNQDARGRNPEGESKITCREVQAVLALLPGDDLDAAEARRARLHLTNCRSCQQDLGLQLRARAVLQELSCSWASANEDRFFAELKSDILSTLPVERAAAERAAAERAAAERAAQRTMRWGGMRGDRWRLARVMTLAAMVLLAGYAALLPAFLGEPVKLTTEPVLSARPQSIRHKLTAPVGLRARAFAERQLELDLLDDDDR